MALTRGNHMHSGEQVLQQVLDPILHNVSAQQQVAERWIQTYTAQDF
jgi:hypothetical protein